MGEQHELLVEELVRQDEGPQPEHVLHRLWGIIELYGDEGGEGGGVVDPRVPRSVRSVDPRVGGIVGGTPYLRSHSP